MIVILAIALGLRAWHLGQLSFWYDEIVTIRLAEAPGPAALVAFAADPGCRPR